MLHVAPAVFGLLAFTCVACQAQEVEISQMQDLPLGTWIGVGDLQGVAGFCVRSDQNGAYAVQALGDGPGGAFELPGPVTSLPYEVEFNGGAGWQPLTAGAITGGFIGAKNKGQVNRCRNNATGPGYEQVRVTIPSASFEQALAGTYTGTLALVVSPE